MKIMLKNYIDSVGGESFDFYMLELTISLKEILEHRGVHVKAAVDMVPPTFKESNGEIWVWGEKDFAKAKEILEEVHGVLQKHNPREIFG